MARKFRLTAEGGRRLDAERAYNVRALERVLAQWSAENVAAFAGFLKRFDTDRTPTSVRGPGREPPPSADAHGISTIDGGFLHNRWLGFGAWNTAHRRPHGGSWWWTTR